jgi:hypothetical protein
VAAELRLGEKCTRHASDLVCLAQLPHLSLKRHNAFFFGVVALECRPVSRSCQRIQLRGVSCVQPILDVIDVIEASL